MADDALFGRDRGEGRREPDELEVAVDEVMSRAVERQLEEQREFNRLVARTSDRLGALEAGLRSWGERTASALTELRGELQQQGASSDRELTARARELAGGLDRMRSTAAQHQVRLVQLAEAAEAAIGALEDRQARLEEEVANLAEELRARPETPTTEELAGLLDRVDRLGELPGRLSRLEEELAGVAAARREHRDAIDATLRADRQELEARIGGVLEAVETRLDDVSRVLSTTLPAHLAAQRDQLTGEAERVLQQVSERVTAAHDELRAITGELAALPARVEERVSTGLEQVAGRVATGLDRLHGHLDRAQATARDEADTVTHEVSAAVDRLDTVRQRLDRLESSLVTYLEARDARLEEERVRVLRDLVEDFARGLSRRQRRKLARRLDDAREHVAPAPPSAPPPRPPGDAASRPGPGPDGDRPGPVPGSLLAELIGEEPPPTATEPDADEEEPATDGHVCPECGFVAGNAGGLGSHRRTHRR